MLEWEYPSYENGVLHLKKNLIKRKEGKNRVPQGIYLTLNGLISLSSEMNGRGFGETGMAQVG